VNAIKKGEWMEFVIRNDWIGHSIEDVLRNILEVPRRLLHEIRMQKGVRCNGRECKWSQPLENGDKLQIRLFTKEEFGVKPNFLEIDILYEDDHLLIANKKADMDTHPSNEDQHDTLANAIAYHFLANGLATKVRHIHRLDRDTTGAVLFAKHALAGALLDQMLEKREITRTYLALVEGQLKSGHGEVNEPIGRDRHHPTRRRVSRTGQKAVTFYKVLSYDNERKRTLLKLHLDTGRTHQIRVHMQAIGHPLAGDRLYGGTQPGVNRQALHAAKISFTHPFTGEEIEIVAPFLDDPPIFYYDLNELTKQG
jgi:23S rRNA pseudouridine1911/1915/1917 synthase